MLLSRLVPYLTPALPSFIFRASSTMSSTIFTPEKPASYVAALGAPPLHLFTANTPNGQKTNIMLEELRLAYPDKKEIGYDFVRVNLGKNEQKVGRERSERAGVGGPPVQSRSSRARSRANSPPTQTPEFLKINPNGRIPALIDNNVNPPSGHNVFESASILLWLVDNYDTEYKLSFKDPLLKSDALSWIFFTHGGVGPMFGCVGCSSLLPFARRVHRSQC